jgi:hypothetical protein
MEFTARLSRLVGAALETQRTQREKIFSFGVERDDKGKTLCPAGTGTKLFLFRFRA